MSSSIPIRRADHHRVLLTETLPEDVPIIFGNEGFYHWMRRHYRELRSSLNKGAALGTAIVDHLTGAGYFTSPGVPPGTPSVGGEAPFTIPFHYPLRVSDRKRRTMSLVHPIAQNVWADFYRRRAGLIVYFAGASAESLRAPRKVAARKYVPNDDEDRLKHRLRIAGASTLDTHMLHRHAASYFAYSGLGKFYKFFDSPRFMDLERRFEVLWLVDVANCFSSIYTHSIAWALQSKEHAKSNIGGVTFATEFDSVMQKANWNETNGIVVGPEVSRVFAELILQRVDERCVQALRRRGLDSDSSFVVHRYVDDYFVFASDELVAKEVVDQLQSELERFHLTLNAKKSVQLRRPFVTERTRAIEAAREVLSGFFDELFDIAAPTVHSAHRASGGEAGTPVTGTTGDDAATKERRRWVPKESVRIGSARSTLVRRVRSLCAELDDGYDLVARFVIAALARKVAEVCDGRPVVSERARAYRDCVSLLLELMLFFYAMQPTVGASVELANGALLATGFFSEGELLVHRPYIERTIYDGCVAFLKQSRSQRSLEQGGAALEALNLVGILGQLSADCAVPWSTLSNWLGLSGSADRCDYFTLMVALHYVRDRQGYDDARRELGAAIIERIKTARPTELASHAELAFLSLDASACPYLPEDTRIDLIRHLATGLKASSAIGGHHAPALSAGRDAQRALVRWMETHPWFIDWNDVRLFRSLERLRVAPGYG